MKRILQSVASVSFHAGADLNDLTLFTVYC